MKIGRMGMKWNESSTLWVNIQRNGYQHPPRTGLIQSNLIMAHISHGQNVKVKTHSCLQSHNFCPKNGMPYSMHWFIKIFLLKGGHVYFWLAYFKCHGQQTMADFPRNGIVIQVISPWEEVTVMVKWTITALFMGVTNGKTLKHSDWDGILSYDQLVE